MEARKQRIIYALQKFIRQRPGLEYGNYGDRKAYFSEMRSITKDRATAETMLVAVSMRDGITADDIISAAKRNFSGRLSIEETDGKVVIDYCTGQYWPTEYRRAVCSVLAGALWDYFWADAPKPVDDHDTVSPGQWVRHTAKRELGRTIAKRWFDA
jgi:hypothetical protein